MINAPIPPPAPLKTDAATQTAGLELRRVYREAANSVTYAPITVGQIASGVFLGMWAFALSSAFVVGVLVALGITGGMHH